MALIDVDDVQPWLEPTKLNLDHNDNLPEAPFWEDVIKSRLSAVGIDTTTWVDVSTTPSLIKSIIGMLVAASRYNAFYSESEDGGNPYADKLEARAMMLIDGIAAGTIDIIGLPDDPVTGGFGSPLFYPTDTTGLLDDEEDGEIKFTMGMRF